MPAARALAFGSSNSVRSGVSKAKAAGDAPKRSDDAAPCRTARLLLDGEAPDGARRATHTAVSANMLSRIADPLSFVGMSLGVYYKDGS